MATFSEVVKQVKEKISLSSLFEEKGHVLQSAGTGKLKTCCPFHNEKTPSMIIYEDTNSYHCFGCGASGDILTFYQKINVLGFKESLVELSGRIGITVDNIESDEIKDDINVSNALRDFSLIIKDEFKKLDDTHPAKVNIKARGLSTNEDWYGWIPKNSNPVLQQLKDKGHTIDTLRKAGLLNKNDGLFFFNRLMFTINNYMGKPLAFSGRQIEDDGYGKYINSPSSEVFNKSKSLFNIEKAKTKISKDNKVYVSEGYFDVISMYNHGYENTVATCGTAFTKDHASILTSLLDNGQIIFVMDGDKAGMKSMYKIFTDFPQLHEYASVIILPNNQDPCDYLQNNGQLPEEESLLNWVYSMLKEKIQNKPPEEIIRLSKMANEGFVNNIKNPNLQRIYRSKVESWCGIKLENGKKKQNQENPNKKIPVIELLKVVYYNQAIMKSELKKDEIPTELHNMIYYLIGNTNIELNEKEQRAIKKVMDEPLLMENDLQVVSHYNYLLNFINKKRTKGGK